MSEQFSLLQFNFSNAPEIECRALLSSVTGAWISGLPMATDEGQIGLRLQRIPERVKKEFGEVVHLVVEPELVFISPGCWQFPKVEHMALVLSPSTSEQLVLVWFERASEPLLSENNRGKIEQLDWSRSVGKVHGDEKKT